MKLIDIHSHLQFSEFDQNRDEVIAEMAVREQGTIVVGTNLETSQAAVDLADKHQNIYSTVGQHPTVGGGFARREFVDLLNKNEDKKIVAVGECGFDFFRTSRESSYASQLAGFQSQIDLAIQFQLPLVLHGRPTAGTMNAYEDMLDLLASDRDDLPVDPGNAHFFVGNMDIAKRFLDLNFTLSFDGPITFARDYDEVIKYVPSDMIHAETDAPYAAPAPYRGQQNSPLYVDKVVKALINIRKENDLIAFRRQLITNAKRVFGI